MRDHHHAIKETDSNEYKIQVEPMLCKSIGYLSLSSQLTEPSMGHEEKEYDDVEGDYMETEKSS